MASTSSTLILMLLGYYSSNRMARSRKQQKVTYLYSSPTGFIEELELLFQCGDAWYGSSHVRNNSLQDSINSLLRTNRSQDRY